MEWVIEDLRRLPDGQVEVDLVQRQSVVLTQEDWHGQSQGKGRRPKSEVVAVLASKLAAKAAAAGQTGTAGAAASGSDQSQTAAASTSSASGGSAAQTSPAAAQSGTAAQGGGQ